MKTQVYNGYIMIELADIYRLISGSFDYEYDL
jgi:hypothetical protein